jgi:hypothetical protein
MTLQQIITDAIAQVQEAHCLKCQIGNSLVGLRDLRDKLETKEEPAAPEVKVQKKTATKKKPLSFWNTPTLARELEASDSKKCRVCGADKHLDEFPINSGCKDGHTNECKPCCAARQKKTAAKKSKPAPIADTPETELKCRLCHSPCASQARLDSHMRVVHGKTEA